MVASHVLETQILPNKSVIPHRFHCARSVFNFRHRIFLQLSHSFTSSLPHARYLPGSHPICLSDKVRFHLMDSLPLWRTLVSHHVRLRARFLSS